MVEAEGFNEWSCSEKLIQIFSSLIVEPDLEWSFVDGSIVKAHHTAVEPSQVMKRLLVNQLQAIQPRSIWRWIVMGYLFALL